MRLMLVALITITLYVGTLVSTKGVTVSQAEPATPQFIYEQTCATAPARPGKLPPTHPLPMPTVKWVNDSAGWHTYMSAKTVNF